MQQKKEELLSHFFLSSIHDNAKKKTNTSLPNCFSSIFTKPKINTYSPVKRQKLFTKNEQESLPKTKYTQFNSTSSNSISLQSDELHSNIKSLNKLFGSNEVNSPAHQKIELLNKSERNVKLINVQNVTTEKIYEKRNRQIDQINKKLMFCKDFLTKRASNSTYPSKQPKNKNQSKTIMLTDSTKKNQKKLYNAGQQSIQQFKIIKKLGQGKYGEVCLVIHKRTGFIAAMKIMNKSFLVSSMMIKQLIHEVKIQYFIDHPNVVKLFCFFDDQDNIYLLSQYLSGGHLYSYLQANPSLSQRQVGKFMTNICSAVHQLHRNHIIHRDLKPENMILQNGIVKICDFGWSVHDNTSKMRQTFCGTPLYLSPEILMGSSYNEKADIWALGIIAYQLITKKLPFGIKKQTDLVNITKKRVVFSPLVSQQAKQFISIMLIKNPNQRADITEVLNCDFIKMNCNNQTSIIL